MPTSENVITGCVRNQLFDYQPQLRRVSLAARKPRRGLYAAFGRFPSCVSSALASGPLAFLLLHRIDPLAVGAVLGVH